MGVQRLVLVVVAVLAWGDVVEARSVRLENSCDERVWLALRWKDANSNDWVTDYWWVLDPRVRVYLAIGEDRIAADSPVVYYWAESETHTWRGDAANPADRTYRVEGKERRFRRYEESRGRIDFAFTCAKKRVAVHLDRPGEVKPCRKAGPNAPRRCEEGLLSYEQRSLAAGEVTGYCGQVGAANVAANLCRDLRVTPDVIDAYLRAEGRVKGDGATKAVNIELALNEYLSQLNGCLGYRWARVRPDAERERRIAQLERETRPYPAQRSRSAYPIVGLQSGSSRHFTTVVEVVRTGEGCRVVHLTWGRLYETGCVRFAGLMQDGKSMIVLRAVKA